MIMVRVRGNTMMKKKVTVLIADIISSRKIEDRERVQESLERVSREMSKAKEKWGLISEPSIMRGDEFEIAFKDTSKCFKAYREIEHKILPYKLRGGIGIGRLDTEIRESTSEMDGPPFHRARKALEDAKDAKEKPIFLIRCGDRNLEETLDTLLNLVYSVKNDWTKREREFAEYYLLREGGVTHEEIGQHFGVSRSTVSRTLSRAHLSAVEKGEELILKKLS